MKKMAFLISIIWLSSCQYVPATPKPLLKWSGSVVFVNQGPPERLPWRFQSLAEAEAYYGEAVKELKGRSGAEDAKQAADQEIFYFLTTTWFGRPKEKLYMGQVNISDAVIKEIGNGYAFDHALKKCSAVKQLEGQYLSLEQMLTINPYSIANFKDYNLEASRYSFEWNDAMVLACVKKFKLPKEQPKTVTPGQLGTAVW